MITHEGRRKETIKTIRRLLSNKYIKIGGTLLFLLISIRPVLFTVNLVRTSFYLERKSPAAPAYMLKTLRYRQGVYGIFNEYAPGSMENYAVKQAVVNNNREILETFGKTIDLKKSGEKFNDNFYVQNLFNRLDINKDWANMDDVSFEMLADPKMNRVSTGIFKKIAKQLDRPFTKNLVDFTCWKGNHDLSHYLISLFVIGDTPYKNPPPLLCGFHESVAQVRDVLLKNYGLKPGNVRKNLTRGGNFENLDEYSMDWRFILMAGKEPFARGSFQLGLEKIGRKSQNQVARLMGFFVEKDSDKARPRGGLRYIGKIDIETGYYVLSFDYYTKTGQESPSFHVGGKIPEKRLKPTRRTWKKIIFIIDNSGNACGKFNFNIRMWGTGSLLIDNIFLAKITNRDFLPGESILFVEDSKVKPGEKKK